MKAAILLQFSMPSPLAVMTMQNEQEEDQSHPWNSWQANQEAALGIELLLTAAGVLPVGESRTGIGSASTCPSQMTPNPGWAQEIYR